jgi:hypothetical protein
VYVEEMLCDVSVYDPGETVQEPIRRGTEISCSGSAKKTAVLRGKTPSKN